MRSRPDVKLYLDPPRILPGRPFRARVVLVSRSETPTAGVDVRLTGREAYYPLGRGEPPAPIHTHVDLVAQLPRAVLAPGELVREVVFDLPPSAPPSYRSARTSIGYELVVHVDIPWWPDRTARYLVPVEPLPSRATGKACAFRTGERADDGRALHIEVSLDDDAVPLGGALRGAASLTHVAHHRIRRVELSLLTTERRRGQGAAGVEAARYTVKLTEGAPPDGQAVPFHVALPKDAPASFAGAVIEVSWSLEVRAVIALGSDVTLTVPFRVHATAENAPAEARPARRVPPVGRERRALVWAESARHHGLACNAEEESMTLDLGAVSLTVTREARKSGALAQVAALTWPRLGIDLAISERRWIDAWSGGAVAVEAPAFADRFTVRGREAAQVRAFLDAALRGHLAWFDEAAVGDEGATLVSTGEAQNVDELDAFVSHAVTTARALADATARVPPPEAMAGDLPAWLAFAAALGGQLVPGDMSIHGAALDETGFALTTEWSKEGAPSATVARFALPEHGRERDAEGAGAPPPLDGATQALWDSLSKQVTALALEDHAVVARLPAPVADPAALEPVLAGLAKIARRLAGGSARGPYR